MVLRSGNLEWTKALPLGVRGWTDEQTRKHIEKVMAYLMKVSGVENIKLSKCIDESLH